MKSSPYILAFVALLAVYHSTGLLWGRNAKLYFLIGMLALYGVAGVVLFFMRRRLRPGVQHMDSAIRTDLLREHPEVADEFPPSARVPWLWRVLDTVLGITFAFGPAVIVSFARRQPLTWESEFTGYHVFAMVVGIGVYYLGRAYVLRQYRRGHGVSNDNAEQSSSPPNGGTGTQLGNSGVTEGPPSVS